MFDLPKAIIKECLIEPFKEMVRDPDDHSNESILLKNKLGDILKEKGMTEEDFSKKIGTTDLTIKSIINGRFVPNLKFALIISIFVDTPINELFWLEENPDYKPPKKK